MPGEIPFAWIERPEGVKVTRSGQRKRSTFAAKGNQRLHRAFAEGPRANDRYALVVLQGAGDDF
jgi:hypothetical protein